MIPQLVNSPESFKANMNYLRDHFNDYLRVGRPNMVKAWYAARDASDPKTWLFGPSKFVGYEGMKAKRYEDGYGLDGGVTEKHLQQTGWFTSLPADSSEYLLFSDSLQQFLAEYNQTTRVEYRLNVLTDDLAWSDKRRTSAESASGFIFISYSKASQDSTKKLARQLTMLGYTVWWDTELTAGEDFEEVIRSRIDEAQAAIVIWTSASVKSRFVKSEANRALNGNKLIGLIGSDISIDKVPMPFDQLHIESVENISAIEKSLRKFGVNPT